MPVGKFGGVGGRRGGRSCVGAMLACVGGGLFEAFLVVAVDELFYGASNDPS
jgi:hypothetical protein